MIVLSLIIAGLTASGALARRLDLARYKHNRPYL